jgi:hypothetical protein
MGKNPRKNEPGKFSCTYALVAPLIQNFRFWNVQQSVVLLQTKMPKKVHVMLGFICKWSTLYQYVRGRGHCEIHLEFWSSVPSSAMLLNCSAFGGLMAFEAWQTMNNRRWKSSRSFLHYFVVSSSGCYKQIELSSSHRKRTPLPYQRPFPPYPRYGGASSANKGRVEVCVWRISWDPVCFRVLRCDYRFGYSFSGKRPEGPGSCIKRWDSLQRGPWQI